MAYSVWDVNCVEPFDRLFTSREVNKLSVGKFTCVSGYLTHTAYRIALRIIIGH